MVRAGRDHRSHQEHLYEGDTVVIAYRQMLKEQIEIVQRGGDPMNVMRDPVENVPWVPTLEGWPQLPLKPRPDEPAVAAAHHQLSVQFPQSIQSCGSTLRMTWTATAPIGNSFSSCTRRPTG